MHYSTTHMHVSNKHYSKNAVREKSLGLIKRALNHIVIAEVVKFNTLVDSISLSQVYFLFLFGTGTGSEIMQRLAAPMVGGMLSALFLTLLVIPVLFYFWKNASNKSV